MALYVSGCRQKCRVIILSKKTSNGWSDLEENFDIVYLPFNSYFVGAIYLLPYLFFKSYGDVSFTFSSQTIINGTLGLAKRLGFIKAKVILRESNSIFQLLSGYKLKIYSLFYAMGYKGSSLVITQTDYMKKQLMEALPSLTKKLNIKTISNPFNFDDINSRTGAIDKEYETKKFIVAAGRLAPAKGFDILIEAFKDIAVINNDLDLIILGEGAERNNLNKKIEELSLKERIHMPGYVKNVYAYFKRAEVCVLSSRIEGFPNVLLQMMSQNTAIVATLSAGGIEDIPNIQTCPTENTEKLKSSIINVLQSDTKANKPIFDSFLKSRTQSSFYAQIMESVK